MVPTLCQHSGIVSPLRLRWVNGACVFRCTLPPALLAKCSGPFTCHCGNAGLERTLRYAASISAAKGQVHTERCKNQRSLLDSISRLDFTGHAIRLDAISMYFLSVLTCYCQRQVITSVEPSISSFRALSIRVIKHKLMQRPR